MYTKYLLSALLLATSTFTLQAQQDTTIHWRKHILDLKDSKGRTTKVSSRSRSIN